MESYCIWKVTVCKIAIVLDLEIGRWEQLIQACPLLWSMLYFSLQIWMAPRVFNRQQWQRIDFSNGHVVPILREDRSVHTNLCCNNIQVEWNILISMFRIVNPPKVVTRHIASFAMHAGSDNECSYGFVSSYSTNCRPKYSGQDLWPHIVNV